jgi:hypothetical protein
VRKKTIRLAKDAATFLVAAAIGFAVLRCDPAWPALWGAFLWWPLPALSAVFGFLRPCNAWRWGMAVAAPQVLWCARFCLADLTERLFPFLLFIAPPLFGYTMMHCIVSSLAGGARRILIAIRRRGRLRGLAQERGLLFARRGDLALLGSAAAFDLFSKEEFVNQDIGGMLHGKIDNRDVAVFDHRHDRVALPDRGESRREREQRFAIEHEHTVVWIRSAALQLPRFSLGATTLGRRLGLVLDGIEIFASPAFTRQYLLRSADADRMRELFTSEVLAFWEAAEEIACEGDGQELILYRTSEMIRTKEIRPFLDAALRLVTMLENRP